jgi:hypothetical protein
LHHEKDSNDTRSKHMAHTMDGVVIGCSPTSYAIIVYNPKNRQYYKLDSYCLDSYCLPGSVYPTLKYNGGLFCLLLRNNNPSFEEKYPPGTQVKRIDPSTNMLLAGTVMDIPFPLDPSGDGSVPLYTILFNNGTMASIPLGNKLVSFLCLLLTLPTLNLTTLSNLHFSV